MVDFAYLELMETPTVYQDKTIAFGSFHAKQVGGMEGYHLRIAPLQWSSLEDYLHYHLHGRQPHMA